MISYHGDIQLWYPDYAKSPQAEFAYVQKRLKDADLVLRYLPKHDRGVVVQAGAHSGLWPQRLSSSFARVITFEPDPAMSECAKRNMSSNKIELHEAALGDAEGTVRFLQRGSPGTNRVDDHGQVEVHQVRIDDILNGARCDAIVLDVEGYEVQALKGAVKTIMNWCPVIQVEMLERSAADIDRWLKKMSYRQRMRSHNDAVYTR